MGLFENVLQKGNRDTREQKSKSRRTKPLSLSDPMGFFKRISRMLKSVKDDLHGGSDEASKVEEVGRMANDVGRRVVKGIVVSSRRR